MTVGAFSISLGAFRPFEDPPESLSNLLRGPSPRLLTAVMPFAINTAKGPPAVSLRTTLGPCSPTPQPSQSGGCIPMNRDSAPPLVGRLSLSDGRPCCAPRATGSIPISPRSRPPCAAAKFLVLAFLNVQSTLNTLNTGGIDGMRMTTRCFLK